MKNKKGENGFYEKLARGISKGLDVPQNSFRFLPQIELIGNKEATIEGVKSVVEYDSDIIKLNLGKFNITFKGDKLSLASMEGSSSFITGTFTSVEFSN
ncbi:MAG: YabP/YqfC family sporulation protein [Oscillospiraceae bacterium]